MNLKNEKTHTKRRPCYQLHTTNPNRQFCLSWPSSRKKNQARRLILKRWHIQCFSFVDSIFFCWFHPSPNRSRHCDAQTFTSTFDPQKTWLSRGELHHPFCHDVIALRNRGGGSGRSTWNQQGCTCFVSKTSYSSFSIRKVVERIDYPHFPSTFLVSALPGYWKYVRSWRSPRNMVVLVFEHSQTWHGWRHRGSLAGETASESVEFCEVVCCKKSIVTRCVGTEMELSNVAWSHSILFCSAKTCNELAEPKKEGANLVLSAATELVDNGPWPQTTTWKCNKISLSKRYLGVSGGRVAIFISKILKHANDSA